MFYQNGLVFKKHTHTHTLFQRLSKCCKFQTNRWICMSDPEMKARDAYVPFLVFKSQSKNGNSELYWHKIWEIDLVLTWQNIFSWYFKFPCQHNSEVSFLICDLNIRNGTYASLAFISGVGHKNSSTGCEITTIWKFIKKA